MVEFKDVKLLTNFFSNDDRGYFNKIYLKSSNENLDEVFITKSGENVIRGLHFQLKNPQAKYITVLSGKIMDVVVDLRIDSATFGLFCLYDLDNNKHETLYIPKGFAHGFQVLSDTAIVHYACVGKYETNYDSGIYYNDKNLNIPWKGNNHIISIKDKNLMTFEDLKDLYGGL